MTLEQVKTQIEEIYARTDIGPAQKAAMALRVKSLARRENPELDLDELGV